MLNLPPAMINSLEPFAPCFRGATTWQKAQVLLRLLVTTFVPAEQALVLGIDPTIERRWGHKIAARGIYRDAVRSSDSHFVKTSGLRWISLMLLTPIGWALPVMTVLSPSERYYQQRGRQAKTLLERSLQMVKLLRRCWPQRERVVVGDNAFAALDFLEGVRQAGVTFIARLRLDAALQRPGSSAQKGATSAHPGNAIERSRHRLAASDCALV